MSKQSVYDSVSHSLGGEHKKAKKEVHEIRTRKAKSGGFIHEHHHTHPEDHPMEEHTTPDQDAMAEHMLQNMGSPNPGEADADAGDSGAAAPAPAGGAAAGGASASAGAIPGV
jgi:hypothetical protein